jgi:hypothetical protein
MTMKDLDEVLTAVESGLAEARELMADIAASLKAATA